MSMKTAPEAPSMTVAADCLLQNISRELEDAVKKRLTIDNPEYLAAKKFGRWIGKKMQPQLKYYEPLPRGLRFPRGFANQAVLLCREIIGQDPEIIDRRRLLSEIDYQFHGLLRPYQRQAVAAVSRHSFGVLEAGTGSGKTVMALAIIAARRQPALVIVHTKELLYQWRQRAEEYLACPTGLLGDGKADIQPLTIAIVNSARKRAHELAPLFGHLVVDECHRVPASLFTDVVSVFDCHYQLGLSATAFRRDSGMTRLIYFFMGDRAHKVDQEELAASGAIVRPELVRRITDFDFNYQGEYQEMIKALVTHQGRNRQILDDILHEARRPDGGIALVVSDRVSHCRFFVEQLDKHGLKVALLTGQQTPEQRAAVVNQVRQGELRVLVATIQLIGEGFDCPGLTSLFLTTPITFEGRLLQIIGRIMRPAAGKQARVFDYVDERLPALRRSAWNRRQVLDELG
ncbi:MAG: DEAD/DEAH box helicase [Desulfobulbaceae bacterium]|jgi:superfamily II DNA or RNA helicase|nr:DEAD/DEAH box helicase [Desulfobulbaceae bacterium]